MEKIITLILTLMLAGRSMTLAYISRVGGTSAGDPPLAWLMPLVGDAVIGISALAMLYLIWKPKGLWVWTTLMIWNVLGIWDTFSAFLIQMTNPWNEFFMVKTFGSSMFFGAAIMHLIIIILLNRPGFKKSLLEA